MKQSLRIFFGATEEGAVRPRFFFLLNCLRTEEGSVGPGHWCYAVVRLVQAAA
jgi:hypothetical protein